MASTSMSATIEKIRLEAASFENKDRLLCFSQKNKFQSPLFFDYGDQFFEKWQDENKPRTLASFFPVSAKYDEEMQKADLEKFRQVLKSKDEDFCNQDLYMATGFIKWGEKSLAPALLIPLNYDYEHDTVAISTRAPVENIALSTLDRNIRFPVASDFYKNGHFDIKKFIEVLEKRIAEKPEWKFTRNGCCITFYSTNKLLLKKDLASENWATAKVANNVFFNATIGNDGFLPQPSLFEVNTYDHVFNPADHYFPYVMDSQTNKAAIDALNEQVPVYAIQTLPGSEKAKLAVNIVADLIQQKKKVCVISRRTISKLNFENAWKPPFRSFQGPDREPLQKALNEVRTKLVTYYDVVNNPLKPSGIKLTELFDEIAKLKPVKTKFPNNLFQNIERIRYPKYKSMHASLQQMTQLFFNENGIEVYNAFQGIKLPAISQDRKNMIGEDLEHAKSLLEKIKPFFDNIVKSNLYPFGYRLSDAQELIEIFKKNFDPETPGFEEWNLHSSGWVAYQDNLNELPNAGNRWSSFRRMGSDIYTEDAIDENILEVRDEFARSLGSPLRGLSDHYRRPKRILLALFKEPKSISSDEMLLDKINKLIDIQENRRKYRDSSVLALRLFGKDWKFEKTDWKELANKIQSYYSFRSRNKNDEQYDRLIHILEQWHLFKPFVSEFENIQKNIEFLEKVLQSISKSLSLNESLDTQNVDLWCNMIDSWSKHWKEQDVYLQLCEHIDIIRDSQCENLAEFVKESRNANKEIAMAFARVWTNSQMQAVTTECPDLFTASSKARSKQSNLYRTLLDKFSNSNFRAAHELAEKNPNLLQSIALSQSYEHESNAFDVTLFLDADCTTIAEAMPGTIRSKKIILLGNPCSPSLEMLPMDACNMDVSQQSVFYKDSMLSAALRKGIPTRVIGFTTQYADPSLFHFANKSIYNNEIAQFPNSYLHTNSLQTIKIVRNKATSIAEQAIRHSIKNPSQTLGIVTFNQTLSSEIREELKKLLESKPDSSKFFTRGNLQNRFYIKTVERAIDLYRDVIFVCPDIDGATATAGNRKLSICTTLAKQKLCLFISEEDSDKLTNSKPGLFLDWVNQLKSKEPVKADETHIESVLDEQIYEVLRKDSIPFKEHLAQGGIPIGPVVVDANNPKRFLAFIETDCSSGLYKESVEDREYIRPNTLSRLGWKILNMWLPLWNITNADETENLVTTIAIEQSVAPPPQEESETNDDEDDSQDLSPRIEPYIVTHMPIEGTQDDLPILELPTDKLIQQLKFYVDNESPIHSELLLQRILDLHHIERVGPKMEDVLNETIKQALHEKQFVKTGPFFYSLTNKEIKARDRSKRPDNERKIAYVSPEERALLTKTDDFSLKQTLGLL